MAYKFTIKGVRYFNHQKVLNRVITLFCGDATTQSVMKVYREPVNSERESYTLMVEGMSTQGVHVKQMIGGSIVVEIPWLASEKDVELCYAFLYATGKAHRSARIFDEDERHARLNDDDSRLQWQQRRQNMAEMLGKEELTVITGVRRDFYLSPKRYAGMGRVEDLADIAFQDFIALQWTNPDFENVTEEKRHITDNEELSTLRVVDNTRDVFIGASQYVGMMKGNTCKMITADDFFALMSDQEEFRQMDSCQAFLRKMTRDRWSELFDAAQGIVREHFRKTFIMRWNTDISNYTLAEFGDAIKVFPHEGYYYEWSIWDHQHVHIGDKFYMIRTGGEKQGVVMRGTFTGTPYPDEDWSGRSRKVYYIRMTLSHMIHPEESPLLLTTEALSEAIPDFNWKEGHSGEMLSDSQAERMEEVWHDYVVRIEKIDYRDFDNDSTS
ncbi:MAG: hypothetical protein IKX36_03600 [Prevotella sp.]|nr:hypothetical protein [Prevotella sp.]